MIRFNVAVATHLRFISRSSNTYVSSLVVDGKVSILFCILKPKKYIIPYGYKVISINSLLFFFYYNIPIVSLQCNKQPPQLDNPITHSCVNLSVSTQICRNLLLVGIFTATSLVTKTNHVCTTFYLGTKRSDTNGDLSFQRTIRKTTQPPPMLISSGLMKPGTCAFT